MTREFVDCSCNEFRVYTRSHPITPTSQHSKSPLHCRPKVVRVEEPRELRVNIDNMYIALAAIANNSLVEIAGVVMVDIDSERAIDLQPETRAC